MKDINIGLVNLMIGSGFKEDYVINESKTLYDYVKTVKTSPILRLESKVFNNLENKHIDNDLLASRYIDNNIRLFEVYTLKEIEEEHKKLLPYINEEIDSFNNDKLLLYNSIYTLIKESLNDYDKIDVDAIHESFTVVLNHIKQPKSKALDNVDVKPINEEVIAIAVDKFNEKYDVLDENEKSLLHTLMTTKDDEKEQLLEYYKSEGLALLENNVNVNVKDNVLKAIQKINDMKYNKESFNDDIISLYELKKNLL
jgi:hypothetical protein